MTIFLFSCPEPLQMCPDLCAGLHNVGVVRYPTTSRAHPLLDDFLDDIALFTPNEEGRPVALEPYFRVSAAAFYHSHVVYPD